MKANGLMMLKEKEMGQKSPQTINGSRKVQSSTSIKSMTILGHWEKNKQQTQRGPTGTGQITPR